MPYNLVFYLGDETLLTSSIAYTLLGEGQLFSQGTVYGRDSVGWL